LARIVNVPPGCPAAAADDEAEVVGDVDDVLLLELHAVKTDVSVSAAANAVALVRRSIGILQTIT
jgi:hypothetical protein